MGDKEALAKYRHDWRVVEKTPGPNYDTQYIGSIHKHVDMTDTMKNGTFGAFRDRQRTIPFKGFETAYLGENSPGPQLYNAAQGGHSKVAETVSVTRASQKYSMPKEPRFHSLKKFVGPAPSTYKNTNEV